MADNSDSRTQQPDGGESDQSPETVVHTRMEGETRGSPLREMFLAEPNSVVSLAFGLGFLSVGISMGYFVGLEVVIVKTGVERSELWILSDTISYALWGAFGIALVAFASGVVWLQRVGDMDE